MPTVVSGGIVTPCSPCFTTSISQVITGPRSSGKSALLERVLARREGSGVNALVDGRSAQLSTPEDLRRALTAGDGLVPQLSAWLSAKLGDQSVTKAFMSLGATAVGRGLNAADPAVLTETVKTALAAAGAVPGSSSSMAAVTQVIEKLCAAGKNEAATSKSWPVFVFGECPLHPLSVPCSDASICCRVCVCVKMCGCVRGLGARLWAAQ